MTTTHRFRAGRILAVLGATALAGAALAHPPGARQDMEAAETAAFTEADADGNGTLNAAEFAAFGDLMRQKLDALRFAKLDTNGDGALAKDELADGRPGGHGCGRGPRP